MQYSCFNESRGIYRVFEDDSAKPINGDLPVPKLPSVAGRIGIPARDSARPFPWRAKFVGESWNAKGIVVRCPGSGELGFLEDVTSKPWVMVLAVAGVVAVGVLVVARKKR